MTKEEILDYITSTPENANRRVLSDMIDELISSSGGGGGGLIANITIAQSGVVETYTLDKTWQEINDAMTSGKLVLLYGESENRGTEIYAVTNCCKSDLPADAETPFRLCTYTSDGPLSNYAQVFDCALATDYPAASYSFD